MGAELYDVVASGLSNGIPWEVGATKRGGLVLSVGPATVKLAGVERDRYAEAVARAVTPGQVPAVKAADVAAPDDDADCGCGLGADRCRAAEDGDFGG